MANLITNKYFKSKDIKVFPSSFRGTYKSGASTLAPEITFDPEARLNTEANFILPKATPGKDSYIVQYNQSQNKIAFVLGGYYFEILDIGDYLDEIANKNIGLKLRPITLQDPDVNLQFQLDTSRSTSLLDSWEPASDTILDLLIDDQYCFTGLKVLESDLTTEGSDARIKLFLEDKTVNQKAILPTIEQGTGSNTLLHGEGLIADYPNQTVVGKYNVNIEESLFAVGKGTDDNNRKIAFDVRDNAVIINAEHTIIDGSVHATGPIYTNSKVISALTSSSDSSDTLVTKSYIDNMIGGISEKPPAPPSGDGSGGEQYVSGISQSGAQVSSTLKTFDGSIATGTSSKNAPTAAAVANYVTQEISKLKSENVGGDNTFIQKISESNGVVTATAKAFRNNIDDSDPSTLSNDTAPTVLAVYNYIERIRGGLELKMSEDIDTAKNDAINNTSSEIGKLIASTTSGNSASGKYLQGISQTNGVVTTVEYGFESKLDPKTTANAPTSSAVAGYVDSSIAQIWYNAKTKPTSSSSTNKSLKDIILDATYPIGSIYTYYSESNVSTCPIQNSLGGTWVALSTKTENKPGYFLCAASTDAKSIYRYGNSGGSADAIVVSHNHEFASGTSATTKSNGSHTHEFQFVATAHDGGSDNCFRSAQSNKSGKINIKPNDDQTIKNGGSHTHDIDLSKVTTKAVGSSKTNANLPPYLAVYMWIRTA
jgi:hypothetical protein